MNAHDWTTRTNLAKLGDELVGYRVEGRDGAVGRIEHITYDKSCVVVHTRLRLFGVSHVVPALAVQGIDAGKKRVFLDLTEDEVKGAPEYDSQLGVDEDCQNRVESYYGPILVNRDRARESVT
jgi:hypothetical protein